MESPNQNEFPDLTLPEVPVHEGSNHDFPEQIQVHPPKPEHIQAEPNCGSTDLRRKSEVVFASAPLLWIGLCYPAINFLVLCFGIGPIGLLRASNFYCFSFVFPVLTVVSIGLLRMFGVFRFNWLAYPGFLAWMSLIGYLNMQLFFIAWSGV